MNKEPCKFTHQTLVIKYPEMLYYQREIKDAVNWLNPWKQITRQECIDLEKLPTTEILTWKPE